MDNRTRRVQHELRSVAKQSYFISYDETTTTFVCLLKPYDNGDDDADSNTNPYTGLSWHVSIHLPEDYPFKSPSVGFLNRVFHPNIDYASGTVCLNALNTDWTPLYNVTTIIEQLLPQLLAYPNPDDPLNEEAATLLLQQTPARYNARVQEMHVPPDAQHTT